MREAFAMFFSQVVKALDAEKDGRNKRREP
jgi:hypothetical protein